VGYFLEGLGGGKSKSLPLPRIEAIFGDLLRKYAKTEDI
jgi:hypothetical protein